MKSLIFDTGPIITLTLNSLMWILEPLKKQFGGDFLIPEAVRKELIDRPLEINRFKFEALHTLYYMKKGAFSIYEGNDYMEISDKILSLSNSMFSAKHQEIKICHAGEVEAVALAITLGSGAIVMEERTMRELIENPEKAHHHLEHKLHTRIKIHHGRLNELKQILSKVKVIRSSELIVMAFEMGILDKYLADGDNPKKDLINALLWAIKLNGCSISPDEINEVLKSV